MKFDGSTYLKTYFNEDYKNSQECTLRCYHDVFQSLPNGVTFLEYGCGPSIHLTFTAATKASEIVLCDFLESNREIVRKWLNKDPGAYDWSPYFSYVVQDLEGKGPEEVEKRQNLVRQLVKGVVHCDLTQDPPIEKGYDKEYDVVSSSFCICSVAKTPEEFCQYYSKLGQLVKPGGTLITTEIETEKGGKNMYYVGNDVFASFSVTRDLATKALMDAGFADIMIQKVSDDEILKKGCPTSASVEIILLKGRKI